MDDGPERIEDAEELAQVRRQARSINQRMVLYGALTMLGFLVIPALFGY